MLGSAGMLVLWGTRAIQLGDKLQEYFLLSTAFLPHEAGIATAANHVATLPRQPLVLHNKGFVALRHDA